MANMLREFGKSVVALRDVMDQDRSFNDMELLFIENHFQVIQMAYLRWKRKQQALTDRSGIGKIHGIAARTSLLCSRASHIQPMDCWFIQFLAFSRAKIFALYSVLQVSLKSPLMCVSNSWLPADNHANAMGNHRSASRCCEHALI